MRVFWPSSGIQRNQGVVVGWRIKDTLCVVDIADSRNDDLAGSLKSIIPTTCDYRLISLGQAQPAESTQTHSSATIMFWLSKDEIPILCSESVQLILYTPPDSTRLRFLRTSTPFRGFRNQAMAVQDEYGIGQKSSVKTEEINEIISLINISKVAQRDLSCMATSGYRRNPINNDELKWSTMTSAFLAILFLPLRMCAQALYLTLNHHTSVGSFRQFSSTIDQLALRLSQGIQGPKRFMSTRQVGLGIEQLLESSIPKYLVELPINALKWLNDWPVGLKLNTPLSQFFCTGLGSIMQKWGDVVLPHLDTLLPSMIRLFALSSLGGLTLTLSLLNDTITILTSHFHLCHLLMRYIFNWQLESLSGLWNLFRGKRWNVLRQRTDSYEYDVDQLFLGTLLFTVSAFLFPTVLTYFGLFALFRAATVGSQKILTGAVTALNAFPLFELMLRIKEPSRLPGELVLVVHCDT
ncbi:hypothetical protein L486_05371 [Kwoniella mangroviensis CBS 10435]|uniref:Phosphatidylinositol glycan, class Q n=1 Tax=Kwoniella mangroviensis CBS 10435 TaxID=1331196 RepID=A0A1B9IM57_9TREE|nr:hypothetical protein L486_05371 [Kwoniella mangroviensis CBS 10435]